MKSSAQSLGSNEEMRLNLEAKLPKPEMVAHTALGIKGKAGLSYKATKFLSQNTRAEKNQTQPKPTYQPP